MTEAFVPVMTPRFGPHDPVLRTPARAPGSVRRTTTVDMSRPDGPWGVVVADVRAQDLRTDETGRAHLIARYAVEVRVDAGSGEVVAVDERAGDGDGPVELSETIRNSAGALVGANVRSGYRRRVAELFEVEREARSLRFSVLDDLGGALLVSGYGPLREGAMTPSSDMARRQADAQADICAGWATEGPVLVGLRASGLPAVPMGPPAPDLDRDDPDACHPVAPLARGAVRRRRRLDVIPSADGSGRLRLDSHFRDSYEADDGGMVMHEYAVRADVDGGHGLSEVVVEPRVLPWEACPRAVPSADGLIGVRLDELPARVRAELVGVATCTHLNSTLRCLADATALVAHLDT